MKTPVKIILIVSGIFIAGTLFALFLPNRGTEQLPEAELPAGKQPPLFSDLRLGTPVRAEFAKQKNPPIKQKTEYTTSEPIMLLGTTTSSATKPVEVHVRLVNEQSTIISLKPASVTFDLGTNSYCCWKIETPGQYVLQIFRPDSVVTRLPIKIVKDFEAASNNIK